MRVAYTVLAYATGVPDSDRASEASSLPDAVGIARQYRAKWPDVSIRITIEEYFDSGEMPE